MTHCVRLSELRSDVGIVSLVVNSVSPCPNSSHVSIVPDIRLEYGGAGNVGDPRRSVFARVLAPEWESIGRCERD